MTTTDNTAHADPRTWTVADYSPLLLAQHRQVLYDRGVSPTVAAARGYTSVTAPVDLHRAGFSREQATVCQNAAALLIPLFGVAASGDPKDNGRQSRVGYQMRPDAPRELASKGKDPRKAKYETRGKNGGRGDGNHLDVPPLLFEHVKNIDVPLWITEGPIKGDAFATAAIAAGRPACMIALAGVWNWKNIAEEWDQVPVRGRIVYLAFDSDSATKPEVHRALSELSNRIAKAGGNVKIVNIPAPDDAGDKTGIDDYLVAGGSIARLEATATDSLPELTTASGSNASIISRSPDSAYVDDELALILEKMPPKIVDGIEHTQPPKVLASFAARILRTVCTVDAEALDEDGAPLPPTTRHDIEVAYEDPRDGSIRTRIVRDISDDDLDRLHFRHTSPDLRHITFAPNPADVKKAASAIRRHRPEECQGIVTWSHTGWIDHETAGPVYLHAKGGIGMDGVVPDAKASLGGGDLSHFQLPGPPIPDETLAEAVAASIRCRLVYNDPLYGHIVLGTIYSSVLPRRPEVSLMLVGTKRTGKSFTAGNIIQAHFGEWGNKRLPASFESTANAVEIVTNMMKNAPCGVDDLAPSTRSKGEAQYELLNRIVRGSANNAGRARSTRDGKLRPGLAPRCLPVITAEQIPVSESIVQSLLERAVLLQFGENSLVNANDMVNVTQEAMTKHAPTAMAGYLHWLAKWIDSTGKAGYGGTIATARAELLRRHAKLAADMQRYVGRDNKRACENLAEFALGWEMLHEYVMYLMVEKFAERPDLATIIADAWTEELDRDNVLAAIGELGLGNYDRIESSRVDKAFVQGVQAAITQGAAHLADVDGKAPGDGLMYGWRPRPGDAELVPQGVRIGWVLDDRFETPQGGKVVALHPGSVWRVLSSQDSVFQTLSPRMVWEQCETARLFIDVGSVQKGSLQRKLHIRSQGSVNVLCFAASVFGLDETTDESIDEEFGL